MVIYDHIQLRTSIYGRILQYRIPKIYDSDTEPANMVNYGEIPWYRTVLLRPARAYMIISIIKHLKIYQRIYMIDVNLYVYVRSIRAFHFPFLKHCYCFLNC